jgi:hypothetical protein
MKVYVSAKWQLKDVVSEMQRMIIDEGHSLTADWTTRAFARQYDKFALSGQYADEEAKAILEADVLIHLSDMGGKGKYVDLGCGITGAILQEHPKIYVVGNPADESQFYFHPKVKRIVGEPIYSLEKIILPEMRTL